MKIIALFLDFYGTLVYEDGEVISRICERIRKASPFCPEARDIASYWWSKFNSLCLKSYGDNFQLQRDIELKSLEKTLERFCCNDNAKAISMELFDYWVKPPIFDDTLQFLGNVNIPFCIVSNIDRTDLINALEYRGIKAANIVTSEDARSYKPRPEIFLKGMELMNAQPEDVLHVGDSLSSDVSAAKSLGIRTCWLNRNKRKLKGDVTPDYKCRNLTDVLELIT